MTFSHLDPGTPEHVWRDAFCSAAVPRARRGFTSLVVVSAHPDDETLGVGGLIRQTASAGLPVRIVVATDGEASHPESPTHSPAVLGRIRRDEVSAAIDLLAPGAEIDFLGLADGRLAENVSTLAHAVSDSIRSLAGPVLVVSPWTGDGHRDHRVAAEATAAAARETGAEHLMYPLWLWHWGTPRDAPWASLSVIALDDETRAVKRRAMSAHRSQCQPLSTEPGDEAIVSEGMLQHFERSFESLVAPTPAPAPPVPVSVPTGSVSQKWFDDFYRRHDDPWGFDSRWYEQRKRDLTLAALPRRRYASALEIGCSTGALTAHLAPRCEALLAVDFAESALAAARERLGERENVTLAAAELPREWPPGSFDLIVFAEVGYYWDAADLEQGVIKMAAALRPGGHLLACHWRHLIEGCPTTGDGVHMALRTHAALTTLAHHEEADFQLDVFATGKALSVAEEAGMLP